MHKNAACPKKIEPTETVRHAIGALQGASPSASNAPYVEFLIVIGIIKLSS